MGKVDCFRVDDLDMWFWSDDHLPHHFHVRRADEWHIVVRFMECRPGLLAYDIKHGSPKSKILRTLLKQVLTNREALMAEWNRKVLVHP
jgi:hypothetical protein